MWIYGPALLWIGDPLEVIWATITSTLGIAACAAGIQGYVFRPTRMLERVMLLISALLLIKPGWITDVIGLGLLIPILIHQGLLGKLAALWKRSPSAAAG